MVGTFTVIVTYQFVRSHERGNCRPFIRVTVLPRCITFPCSLLLRHADLCDHYRGRMAMVETSLVQGECWDSSKRVTPRGGTIGLVSVKVMPETSGIGGLIDGNWRRRGKNYCRFGISS